MTVTTTQLINQVRRFVRDWPDQDVLTASMSSSTTTMTVADGTIYPKNFHIEIDSEVLTAAATGVGTSVTVRRGALGTTASTHATASVVLINPHFDSIEILDAINYAMSDSFPYLYKQTQNTTLTTSTSTFEYTIPSLDGVPLRYVSEVELKPTGEFDYRLIRDYSINRGTTPKIQFHWEPATGSTMRITGYAPFPALTLTSDPDPLFPDNAFSTLVLGAASYLLASGEAGRVRADTGLVDQREQANRAGSSLTASNSLYQRFRQQLGNNIMPRLPIHCKPTF